EASLFARDDEIERAWQLVQPVLERWAASPAAIEAYAAGSWGPSCSNALLAADGRRWWNPSLRAPDP
ncbi:MAG TPA: glucose-6-phosphate dehydrogenase, partial [Chthonomonadales bacterium]|nr:glucose-6-phosphate dehydrogenase [Chthonomonadales bacterium]